LKTTTKTEPKRDRKPQAPKKVIYLNTYLGCQRCTSIWQVIDLNPELRVVKCPTCAEPNDIREAIKRAA
jgi:transcription elongation factor Elf1